MTSHPQDDSRAIERWLMDQAHDGEDGGAFIRSLAARLAVVEDARLRQRALVAEIRGRDFSCRLDRGLLPAHSRVSMGERRRHR